MIRISLEDIQETIARFKKYGIPFKMRLIGRKRETIEISVKHTKISNNANSFPSEELCFIKQVKSHIIKNKLYEKIKPRFKKESNWEKIKYFTYNKNIPMWTQEIITDAYEIDLKSAYWEIAYEDGWISKEIYEKANNKNPKTGRLYMSKDTRLAALGSLARRYEDWEFDGKKEIFLGEGRDVRTEAIWFSICDKTSRIMNQARRGAGKDFLFYWVDALFCRLSAQNVKNVFTEMGYKSTVDKLKYVHKEGWGMVVTDYPPDKYRKLPHLLTFGADWHEGSFCYLIHYNGELKEIMPVAETNYWNAVAVAKKLNFENKQKHGERFCRLYNNCRSFNFQKEDIVNNLPEKHASE